MHIIEKLQQQLIDHNNVNNYIRNHLAMSDTNVFCVWNYSYSPSHLVYSYYVGRIPVYVITDTELIKQILVKQFDHFIDRFPVSESVLTVVIIEA